MPSSALPAWPHGLLLGRGRPLPLAAFAAGFLAFSFTTFFVASFDLARGFALDFAALAFFFVAIFLSFPCGYFFASLLCGLRLPMRPLSLPAAGSITALISVGFPESIAALTARLSSSGLVALMPTPPNASIILS